MKKQSLLLLSSSILLAACSSPTTEPSADTSTTVTTVNETTTTAAPVINYEEKYQVVFDYYRTIASQYYNLRGKEDTLQFPLYNLKPIYEEYKNLKYAFQDINNDGISEMIVAYTTKDNSMWLQAIYALKDNQPELFTVTTSSENGGDRYISTLLPNGDVLVDNHSSGTGDGIASIISLEKDTNTTIEKAKQPFEKMQIPYETFGITKDEAYDLDSLEWHSFIRKPDANQVAKMDINAIQQGDFSSIKGTWEDGSGKIVTFDDNGISSDANNAIALDRVKLEDGILKAGVQPKSGVGVGYSIWFIPAGVVIPTNHFGLNDGSDTQFDRVLVGQDFGSIDHPEFYYYRVAD